MRLLSSSSHSPLPRILVVFSYYVLLQLLLGLLVTRERQPSSSIGIITVHAFGVNATAERTGKTFVVQQQQGFVHIMSEEEEDGGDDEASESTATAKKTKKTTASSSSSSNNNNNNNKNKNVLGTALSVCCTDVGGSGLSTGFDRDGHCTTGASDYGRHTVCARVTTQFLQYSKSVGNDLTTKDLQYQFPGLKHGDLWCLCAQRWFQAYHAGVAPPLFLNATHEKTLKYVPLEALREYDIDKNGIKSTSKIQTE